MNVSIFPSESLQFFKNVVLKTIHGRQEEQEHRTDFLQLMLDARNEENNSESSSTDSNSSWDKTKGLTGDVMLSNAVLFLIAGYDTTAATISFVSYCLAMNPDCQEKLYEEVARVVGNKETIDYDTLSKLTYLDQCINETLRLYAPAVRIDRLATEDTVVGGIPVTKGSTVAVHVYAMHHDPLLWPDPEKFDPDRFTPEAVSNRHPMQFLPFSQGPRMCIGMRLAQLKMKVGLAHLVKNFRFVRCAETEVPLQFAGTGLLQPKSVNLKLEVRKVAV